MFPRHHPGPVFDDLDVHPGYTDLAVTRVDAPPNHDVGQISVSAVVSNHGVLPPSGPFCVYVAVLTYLNGVQKGTQEWRWYQQQTFPFRTLATTAKIYYAEDGGDQYWVQVVVDSTEVLADDPNRRNNIGYLQCPPFHKPGFVWDGKQPLRIETTVEDGNHMREVTLGGKPLKAS